MKTHPDVDLPALPAAGGLDIRQVTSSLYFFCLTQGNRVKSLIFQLKLEVQNVRRPVWRRFEVPSNQTFWDLHCTIQDLLDFSLPRETGAGYPNCLAGEGAVFESKGGALGFNESVETGTGLPRGFDPKFFDPAAVRFVDSMEEHMWTTYLDGELRPELVVEVFGRVFNGI